MAVRLFYTCRGAPLKSLCFSTTHLQSQYCSAAKKPDRKPLYKREEAKKIRFFFVDRYVKYLTNYDKVLEKRFPRAVRVYRMFMDGIKFFYKDLKEYLRLVRLLNIRGNTLKNLTRKEIELYQQMPKDMMKVAPVLTIAMLPFANYVILPLAYLFPKQLLCSHFWNLQQKSEFSIAILQDRLVHNRPVFRNLQAQLKTLQENPLHEKWSCILASLGSGSHPSVHEILECKKLFTGKPYHLFYLPRNHINHLLLMHDMHRAWFKRSRLAERAGILQAMDRAILREGGVENLPPDALKTACFLRGLNPTNMKHDDMVNWLICWMAVSNEVDRSCLSLLLHTPIFLAYNHPSNWQLIYKDKNSV